MYDSENKDYSEDPGVINAQYAAKMGIDYPLDFEKEDDDPNALIKSDSRASKRYSKWIITRRLFLSKCP